MSTLSINPTYVYEEAITYKTSITTYEDGTETRHSRGSPKRMFTLRFLAVDEATRDTLHNFHQATYGSATTFQWENPLDLVTYNVRFMEDTLTEENISYNDTGDIFNIECKLLEVVSV